MENYLLLLIADYLFIFDLFTVILSHIINYINFFFNYKYSN